MYEFIYKKWYIYNFMKMKTPERKSKKKQNKHLFGFSPIPHL